MCGLDLWVDASHIRGVMNPANTRWRLSIYRGGLAALLLASHVIATANVEIDFAVEEIAADDWQITGIVIELRDQRAGELDAIIRIETMALPDGHGRLADLTLACGLEHDSERIWRCANGDWRVADSPLGPQDGKWSASLTSTDQWHLEIPRIAVGSGSVAVTIASSQAGLEASARLLHLPLQRLPKLTPQLVLPTAWGFTGRISGRTEASRNRSGSFTAQADLLLDRLNYASPDGRQAAEDVTGKIVLKGHASRAGDWVIDARLAMPRGALYSEPIFLDAAETPLNVRLKARLQPVRQRVYLDSWSLDLDRTAALFGTGRLRLPDGAIDDLTVVLRSDDAAGLYQRLLQPFLIGSPADDLEMAGRMGMALHIDRKGIEQAGLDLQGLVMEDRQGRFALGPASGSIAWDRAGTVGVSHLAIEGASVYRVPTGRFDISARFSGDAVTLTRPLEVPLLGGSVTLDRFDLSGALVAGAQPQWQASASLQDVSLDRLTEAFGWPAFGGIVSGQIQDMRYADQVFMIGGALRFKAFDGDVSVSGLKIGEPLGTVPTLQADLKLRGLDLELLTKTFSFGRIEGRLNGDIDRVRLVAWQPDAFNLHLYTPEDDLKRRRISQRAVENLTELGSGIPAGLSSTVLRLFEEFRYKRIELKIALDGDVARLDGLARPDGGYYLVQGSGLPRIDVIGRNRSVAWKDLVERLRQIQVQGARIE
jgi:hypothetical protein